MFLFKSFALLFMTWKIIQRDMSKRSLPVSAPAQMRGGFPRPPGRRSQADELQMGAYQRFT